jgi:hypothetical protein
MRIKGVATIAWRPGSNNYPLDLPTSSSRNLIPAIACALLGDYQLAGGPIWSVLANCVRRVPVTVY